MSDEQLEFEQYPLVYVLHLQVSEGQLALEQCPQSVLQLQVEP